MSIQDDMYDVEAEVKGTDAEEAFERFSTWAGQMEADLEKVIARYNVVLAAFRLVKDSEEISKEIKALDAADITAAELKNG